MSVVAARGGNLAMVVDVSPSVISGWRAAVVYDCMRVSLAEGNTCWGRLWWLLGALH